MTDGQLKPTGAAETIVSGLPADRQHEDKGIAFDGRGGLYVNVGAPSNACQDPDRRPGVKGVDPVPAAREARRHLEVRREQRRTRRRHQGTRFATGLRQMPAITWHDDALFIAMNNRDQLDVFWPSLFTAKDNAERPAEPLYRAVQGSDFGWPYCYYDYTTKMTVLNPEYGGDGKTVGRCSTFTPPVAAFPAHWAPRGREVLHRHAVSGEVPQRRVHRVPRLVEPRARAAGRLQRHVPADRERQGRGRVRGVRGRLCRQGAR